MMVKLGVGGLSMARVTRASTKASESGLKVGGGYGGGCS